MGDFTCWYVSLVILLSTSWCFCTFPTSSTSTKCVLPLSRRYSLPFTVGSFLSPGVKSVLLFPLPFSLPPFRVLDVLRTELEVYPSNLTFPLLVPSSPTWTFRRFFSGELYPFSTSVLPVSSFLVSTHIPSAYHQVVTRTSHPNPYAPHRPVSLERKQLTMITGVSWHTHIPNGLS